MKMSKEKYEAYMKHLRGEDYQTPEQKEREYQRRQNIREYEWYCEDEQTKDEERYGKVW